MQEQSASLLPAERTITILLYMADTRIRTRIVPVVSDMSAFEDWLESRGPNRWVSRCAR